MRRAELLELVHEPLGRLERLGRVEHEVAQEGVQVAEVLGRLRLVQEPQRQLALDAEQAAKALLIRAELASSRRRPADPS